MRAGMKLTAFLTTLLVLAAPTLGGGGPQNVLVVVNGRDPDSVAIGLHYLAARGVPPRNLVTLDLATDLTVSLPTYKERIEEPVKDHMARKGIADHIDYLVLTRGLPILVEVPGKSASTAACLATMDTPISGRNNRGAPSPSDGMQNPFRLTGRAFRHAEGYGDQKLHLYLVNFLTGYTAEDSMALVDRAAAAEAAPPEHPRFHFQDAGGSARGRNPGYAQAIRRLSARGFESIHHKSGADRVKGRKNIMGWMSGGSYSGLTEAAIASNEYPPGAIVDMLESFGAVPQNFDPQKKSQVPVTWFIKHGITGVHGTVAEPYAHTFPDVLLFERYASGMNLAEAFHASLPFLYWMNLVIGDPLCAPFARRPKVSLSGLPTGPLTGRIAIEVAAAPKARVREITLYVDGLPVGRAEGAEGMIELDTMRLADGPHHVLASAVLTGDLEIQGWAVAELVVRHPDVVPIAARAGPLGSIRIELSRPPEKGASVAARLAGKEATVRIPPGEAAVILTPAEPLLAGTVVKAALRGSITGEVACLVPPSSFLVKAPAEIVAGEKVNLRAVALDGNGDPVEMFSGRVSVTLSTPPITGGETLLTTPMLEAPFTLEKAGEVEIRVRDRLSGAEGSTKVRVLPGTVARCVVAPSTLPQGEAADITVTLLDRYQNKVEYSGEVSLSLVSDSRAVVPGPVKAAAGRATFKGVVAWRRGTQPVFVRDEEGNRFPGTPVKVRPFAVRRWLVSGPVAGELDKLAATSVAGLDPVEGRVSEERVWRTARSGGDDIDLSRVLGSEGEGLDRAHVHVYVPKPVRATLRLGFRPRVVLFVDGKEVFRAKNAKKKVKADQVVIPRFPLDAGWHRILVVAEHQGSEGAFSFRISDGEGNAIPGVRTSLSGPAGPR